MQAAVFHGRGDMRLGELPEPVAAPGWVVIQVFRAGICGTELRRYAAGPERIPVPMVLGHEFAGTVVQVGQGVDTLTLGDRVTVAAQGFCGRCWTCHRGWTSLCEQPVKPGSTVHGGFASQVAVPASIAFRVPNGVDLRDASLTEPTAVAYHAVQRSGIRLGQTALVVGAGPIGLGVIQVLVASGIREIVVSEMSTARQRAARALGATRVLDTDREEVLSAVREATDGRGADVAFEVAGVQSALETALAALRKRGVCMHVAARESAAQLGMSELLRKEVELRFAFGCEAMEDFPTVLGLIARGAITPSALVSDEIPLEAIVERGFEELRTNNDAHVKILVAPNGV